MMQFFTDVSKNYKTSCKQCTSHTPTTATMNEGTSSVLLKSNPHYRGFDYLGCRESNPGFHQRLSKLLSSFVPSPFFLGRVTWIRNKGSTLGRVVQISLANCNSFFSLTCFSFSDRPGMARYSCACTASVKAFSWSSMSNLFLSFCWATCCFSSALAANYSLVFSCHSSSRCVNVKDLQLDSLPSCSSFALPRITLRLTAGKVCNFSSR